MSKKRGPLEIVWSPLALARLQEIRAFIALDKPEATERLATRIVWVVEALRIHPYLGRIGPEPGIRELNHRRHSVFHPLSHPRQPPHNLHHLPRLALQISHQITPFRPPTRFSPRVFLLLTTRRRRVCSTWMPVGRENSYAGQVRRCRSGDFGHAGSEDARARTDAWIRDICPHRADEQGRFSSQCGVVISRNSAATTRRTHRWRMEGNREQPPREVLRSD